MGVIPPWSDLPSELLSHISNFLVSNPLDVQSFRAVCKTWSSSPSSSVIKPTKLFSPLPLTIPCLPATLRSRYSSLDFPKNIVSVTVVYCLRSPIRVDLPASLPPPSSSSSPPPYLIPSGWILFVDQTDLGKLTIRKPFSNRSYTLPLNFPKSLDMLSYHATELSRFCSISRSTCHDGRLDRLNIFSGFVRKVVLFHSESGPGVIALSDDGKLGLLRLDSVSDKGSDSVEAEWEVIHDGKGFRFDDIIEFKGRVLGIDRRCRVYDIETVSRPRTVAINPVATPITGGGGKRKRLVESLGRLYLVVRSSGRDNNVDPLYKVYELKAGAKKWVEVHSLGDRTFFFGQEFSFSVPAERLHGLYGKNSVMFHERSFVNYNGYDDDAHLFCNLLPEELNVGVWSMGNAAKLGLMGRSLPGYSNALWPPPVWLWPIDVSERAGILVNAINRIQRRIPNCDKFNISKKHLDNFPYRVIPPFFQLSDCLLSNFANLSGLTPLQQNYAFEIIKSNVEMKSMLEEATMMNQRLKHFDFVAMSWQRAFNASNQHNQGGTVEHRGSVGGSFKFFRDVTRQGPRKLYLLSLETRIHICMIPLEGRVAEFENYVNTSKFSAYVDELAGFLNST